MKSLGEKVKYYLEILVHKTHFTETHDLLQAGKYELK